MTDLSDATAAEIEALRPELEAQEGAFLHRPPLSSTEQRAWPERPALAFEGLPGEIARSIEPYSEADPTAVLAQLLVAFGSACGRGPGWSTGGSFHATNLYLTVVGPTSSGRKGEGWGFVRTLLREADQEWTGSCIKGGLTSGEGIVHAVRDPRRERVEAKSAEEKDQADQDGLIEKVVDGGVADKRLLAFQGEFAQVLRNMKRESNTLSSVMRDLWDGGSAATLTKNSSEATTDALVSVVAHITPAELKAELKETELANGLANRFLFLCSRRTKELPFSEPMPQDQLRVLAKRVRVALEFAGRQGSIGFDGEARDIWKLVYGGLTDRSDDLVGAVTGRAAAQVRRLAVLYALLALSPVVRRPHLQAALSLWDYCEASAAYLFGGRTGYPLADKLRGPLVEAHPGELTRTDIRELIGHRAAQEEIDEARDYLLARGLIAVHTEPGPGRHAEMWRTRERGEKPPLVEERVEEGGFPPPDPPFLHPSTTNGAAPWRCGACVFGTSDQVVAAVHGQRTGHTVKGPNGYAIDATGEVRHEAA